MKKFIFSLLTVASVTSSMTYASGDIVLGLGQSVNISGTTVTCASSAPTPSSPSSQCNRLKQMTSEEVFNLGYSTGVGNCYIINNNSNYGVMHTLRGQISPTYSHPHDGSSSYNSNSFTAATGFCAVGL